MTLTQSNKARPLDMTPRAEIVRLDRGLLRYEVHRSLGVMWLERTISIHLTRAGAERAARRFVRRINRTRTTIRVIVP